MLEDEFNILQLAKKENIKLNYENIIEILIDGFKNELMSKNDQNLIKMAFCDNPTQNDLDTFLNKWDIEVAGGAKSLMLAYFMKLHSELNFPEYVGPRLKGLLNYYKFQNMKLIFLNHS